MNIVKHCKLKPSKQKLLRLLFLSGTSARQAARLVGVNRNTAILFFRKIRFSIFYAQKSRILSGVVEVDECYTSSGAGGRKVAKQGRGLAGKIAFVGAFERVSGHLAIERVRNTQEATLSAFCARNIDTGATVHTDCFRAYKLAKLGYKHLKVNHFLTFKNKITGACTNQIESTWAALRRHWVRFNGAFRHNLNLWIAEFIFRQEHKKDLPQALRRALKAA